MNQNMSREVLHDQLREKFNKYTRRAFEILPRLEKPCILDIGCGTGVPTMELARLSDGQIIGIDTDQSRLDAFAKKIDKAGLTKKIKVIQCSMLNMEFPDESFDIIWAEGAMWITGFERCLREWRRFIKPHGFLVAHDEIGEINKKQKLIAESGYTLLDKFILPQNVWWKEYYGPLEQQIRELRMKYHDDPRALRMLDREQNEVKEFKRNPRYHGSVFFIMQKR
jgi:ubiquinone/menaquinone biosynthesis C-methylase UbiE